MFSARSTFGLRLALWYATLFVAGAVGIVFLTYYLTSTSLAQRDQQILRGKLGDYAAAYLRGGMRGLVATVQAEQQVAPERLFVQVIDRDAGVSPDRSRGMGSVAASVGFCAPVGRHAGAGGEEHRGPGGSACKISRGARTRHVAHRRHCAEWRLAGDAIGHLSDPPPHPCRPTHRHDRSDRRTRPDGRRTWQRGRNR